MYTKREKLSVHGFYKIGKIIGDGNFAVVRQCKNRQTGKDYALKVINKAKVKGKEHMIENEILILRRVKHPHIVELIEEFETAKEIFLIMELVSGGDLFDAIVQATRFSERDASHMIRDLASAVNHLHSLQIVHRDIKPENLLVVNKANGALSLKLADFGLSIEVKSPMFLVCGTPTYVAPEILDESGYGLKVDIWAMGVITYILLCGFPPFRSENQDQEELFDKIMRGDYEYLSPFWDDISNSAKDLINHMLVVDVNKRSTAEQVLEHSWIKGNTAPVRNIQRQLSSELLKNFHHRKRLRGVAMAIQTVIALLKYVRQKRYMASIGTASAKTGTFSLPVSPKRTPAHTSRIPRAKGTMPRHHIEEIRKSMTAHIRKYNTYSLCTTKACGRSVSRANSGDYEITETGRYSVIGNVYRRARREGKLPGNDKRPTLDVQLGRQTVSTQKTANNARPVIQKHSCSSHYLSYYETPSLVVGETSKNQAKPRRPVSRQSAASTSSTRPRTAEARPTSSLTKGAYIGPPKSTHTLKISKPSYIPIRSAPSSPKRVLGTPRSRKSSVSSVCGTVSLPTTPGVEYSSSMTSFTYSPASSTLSARSATQRGARSRRPVSERDKATNQVRGKGSFSRECKRDGTINVRRQTEARPVRMCDRVQRTVHKTRETKSACPSSATKTQQCPQPVTGKCTRQSATRPSTLNVASASKSGRDQGVKRGEVKPSNYGDKKACKQVSNCSKNSKSNDGNISITTKTSKTENIKIRLGKTVNKMVETETSTTVSVTIENEVRLKKENDSKSEVHDQSLGQTLLSKVKRLAEEIESLAKLDNAKNDEEKGDKDKQCAKDDQQTACGYGNTADHSNPKAFCLSESCSKGEESVLPSASTSKTVTELRSTEEVKCCPDSAATRKKTSISSHSHSFEEEELDLTGIDDIVDSNVALGDSERLPRECNSDTFGRTEYLSIDLKQDK